MKSRKLSMYTFIFILIVAIGIIALATYTFSWRPDGARSGDYSFYRGPVLPLTSLTNSEGICVNRVVDFDFSPYEGPKSTNWTAEAIVTDSYQLTNTTESEKKVTFAYPFEAYMSSEGKYIPVLSSEGVNIQANLYSSIDSLGAIHDAKDWESYREAILQNSFLEEATTPTPSITTPVTVYEFTDLEYAGCNESETVNLVMTYSINEEKTTVWRYGSVDGRSDTESNTRKEIIHIPCADYLGYMDVAYFIVIGEDLQNVNIQGYAAHSSEAWQKIDDIRYNTRIYETTFGGIVAKLAEHYVAEEGSAFVNTQLLYDGAIKRILDNQYQKFGVVYRNLTELFYSVIHEEVIFYWVFEVKIPSESSINISASMYQQASKDVSGVKKPRDGYDMATRLGSNLQFSEQYASISNTDQIEILRQNFGFDLEQGVVHVKLHLDEERYYLDVRIK